MKRPDDQRIADLAAKFSHLRRHQLPSEPCAYCGDDELNLPAEFDQCPVCKHPGVPEECQHYAPVVYGHCRLCGERLFPASLDEAPTPTSEELAKRRHERITPTHVTSEELANQSPMGCALGSETAWFDGLELEDDRFQNQRLTFEGEHRRYEIKMEELENPLEWNFELYVWQGFERLSRTGRRVRWNR